MLYGLSGPSGSGKTTLAKTIAESLDLTFMPTSITACAQKHGYNSVGMLSLGQRIDLQQHLLHDHMEMLNAAPRPLIVDRTPIDFIAYMMAEMDMHSHLRATDAELGRIHDYVNECLNAALAFYDYVFLLGQLDSYEVTETRPALNRAYGMHTQLLMMGALQALYGRLGYVILQTTDHLVHETTVHDLIVKRMNAIEQEKRSAKHLH